MSCGVLRTLFCKLRSPYIILGHSDAQPETVRCVGKNHRSAPFQFATLRCLQQDRLVCVQAGWFDSVLIGSPGQRLSGAPGNR